MWGFEILNKNNIFQASISDSKIIFTMIFPPLVAQCCLIICFEARLTKL